MKEAQCLGEKQPYDNMKEAQCLGGKQPYDNTKEAQCLGGKQPYDNMKEAQCLGGKEPYDNIDTGTSQLSTPTASLEAPFFFLNLENYKNLTQIQVHPSCLRLQYRWRLENICISSNICISRLENICISGKYLYLWKIFVSRHPNCPHLQYRWRLENICISSDFIFLLIGMFLIFLLFEFVSCPHLPCRQRHQLFFHFPFFFKKIFVLSHI